MIKVAYLIMAYRDPEQVKRLVHSILDSGDCFVHIDKKSDFLPFKEALSGCDNVFLQKDVYV